MFFIYIIITITAPARTTIIPETRGLAANQAIAITIGPTTIARTNVISLVPNTTKNPIKNHLIKFFTLEKYPFVLTCVYAPAIIKNNT